MRTITLAKPWTYRTPTKSVDYPSGEHEVTNEIAAAAEAEGLIPKEEASGAADKPAKAGATGSADAGKG